jgi:hypothetical protein
MALEPFVGPWPLFQFFYFLHSRYDSLEGDKSVARPEPAHRTAQTQNKRKEASMPQVGFEPTIPLFERAKTVHALDRTTTVIGVEFFSLDKLVQSGVFSHGVRLSPLGTTATVWPIVPDPDDDDCGAICGMQISKGHRSTRRKPALVPLCPPQIPHGVSRAGPRAAAVGSRRLTA